MRLKMAIPSVTTKRTVMRMKTGLYKIIGLVDVPEDSVFQQRFENVKFGDYVGVVEFVRNTPRYLLYQEAE
jgi:hypothetical protein